ncbi:urease accessory protein UreF [Rhizorhabdus argentea]|uniref:urease accessory protein UreF n=1 Tax=Rhizorhabdus argentea TaxID=1387174 RepID=UPI0030EEB9E2
MAMGTRMAEDALYDLLSWMSPSYPIGAFAHSSGLEWAVEAGHAIDRLSAEQWIETMIAHGTIRADAVMFVHAHRAVRLGDIDRIAELAELAAALLTSHERRVEATAQGAAFRRIASSTVSAPALAMLDAIDDDALSYPIAVACLTAAQGIGLEAALTAFLHGVVANLVSAAQRLIPLGQTDGQRILRNLRERVFSAVVEAIAVDDSDPFEQLGSASLYSDLACMAHETQYTRLFRT